MIVLHADDADARDTLERIYETMAKGIDAAGRDAEAVFLAKLVLMLAHEAGDAARFAEQVDACLKDLPARGAGA